MSYYYRPHNRFYDAIPAILVGLALVLAASWLVAEFVCTRTFIGTLVSKETPISFTHDSERTYYDDKGNRHTSGDDETIAYKKYLLTFYAEGEMREITAGTSRGCVPYVRADAAALQALAANDVEPAHYTHTKMNTEYLVKVSGWLLDGSIEEITPMSAIKAE
jgi:hypothetical protein